MRMKPSLLHTLACLCWLNCALWAQDPIRGVNVKAASTEAAPRRVALVIGNSAYKDSPLKNPVNDANDLEAALISLGFEVLKGLDVDQRQMKELIRQFGSKMQRGGVGLFYFSGHGIQVKGVEYLIPIKANISKEVEIEFESIETGFVLAQMEAASNRTNIVIMDACRTNPFSRVRSIDNNQELSGSLIAYAASPGQCASDGAGRNGLYTQELLAVIRTPGMMVEQMFRRVREQVILKSRGSQNPWESSSLISDFYFLPAFEQPPISEKGQYHALLIGVKNYKHPSISPLIYPLEDTKLLQRVLAQHYTFEPANITLLENPDRKRVLAKLSHLANRIKPEDHLLIFYAGHGYWDEARQQGYWLPSDAERSDTAEWISNSDMRDSIRAIKAKHILLISDACFSGSIFSAPSRDPFKEAPAIEELLKLQSRTAITSGALTNVPDRSVFAKYLIEYLEKNTDTHLLAGDLFSKIRTPVINNSDKQKDDNRPTPQYGVIQGTEDKGGDFVFFRRISRPAREYIVSATLKWTDTGLDLSPQLPVEILATGVIKFSPTKTIDPNGYVTLTPPLNLPLPNAPIGALVARILYSDGQFSPIQVIGSKKKITAIKAGRLMLGINDTDVEDNSGFFSVTVNW